MVKKSKAEKVKEIKTYYMRRTKNAKEIRNSGCCGSGSPGCRCGSVFWFAGS
ncbi:MAG: hypothetical protein DDT32_02342 [Syntrophomonadaceae bacterium]|nr:hypothetical protein [Bacillota bacterium]